MNDQDFLSFMEIFGLDDPEILEERDWIEAELDKLGLQEPEAEDEKD